MKKIILAAVFAMGIFASLSAQTHLTQNGQIKFFSSTPIEDIEAKNNEAVSTLDTKTGAMNFAVAIIGFRFDLKDMEDHFNTSDYMDSKKYPKAKFAGKIANLSEVNFAKDGTYKVTVQGNLTMKDVTKPVTATGTVTIAKGKISVHGDFNIKRKDFNVAGTSYAQKKIAEDIKITVDCTYEKI
jgi:polyisoprenoid-binding protein YceI